MVTLKGTKDGLLITLGDGEWRAVLADLAAQLERPSAAGFFRGAHARLDIGGRAITEFELREINDLLELHEMQLELPLVIASENPATNGVAEEIAVPNFSTNGHEHVNMTEAALIRRTVRSGQVVRYPGHVVVYADVNPGAEIIAEGDVIVWGRLRGVVHAGAAGDDRAIVGALLLAPMQLRIGTHIARAPDPDGKKKAERGAEIARVRDGHIVIESWKAGKDL